MSQRCTNISKLRKERHNCRYTKETVYTEDGNVVQRTQTATAAQPIGIKPSTAMQIVGVMNEQLRTSIQATHAFRVTMIHTSRTITNPASGQHTPNRQLTSISLIIHLNWSETKRQLPSYSTAEGLTMRDWSTEVRSADVYRPRMRRGKRCEQQKAGQTGH